MQPDQQSPRETWRQADEFHCQVVTCRLDELRPHPSYARNRLAVLASKLAALGELGDLAFREPIIITRDRTIIDGYARWQLARRRGRTTILCLEYELSEEEALRRLIQSRLPARGLNPYSRILLALDLEPALQERARSNRQAGGQHKGSSNLTEATRLDVRSEVATLACSCAGNVTKIKQFRKNAHPRVEQAVRAGEISIHKAWQWSRLGAQQQVRELELYLGQKGTNKISRQLIRKHVARLPQNRLILPSLGDLLKPIVADGSKALDSIAFTEIDSPGSIAYFTKDALLTLNSLEEGRCRTNNC